jgi:putative tricarboxylic transport membrane protein
LQKAQKGVYRGDLTVSTKKEIMGALFFVCLGLFLAWQSLQYRLWARIGPRAGFFPFVIGILIVVLSLVIIIGTLRKRSDPKERQPRAADETGVAIYSKVFCYAISIALFGVLITSVGSEITSFAFLLFLLKFVEKQSWTRTIVVALVSITVSYLLFVRALSVQLPEGILHIH